MFMRLELETAILLGLAVLLYPAVYIYYPPLREGLNFYLMIAIGSAFTIFILGKQKVIHVQWENILDTAGLVFLNMMINAIIFSLLGEMLNFEIMNVLEMLYITQMPLLYAFYIGLGETLLYAGLPFALSEYMPRKLRHITAVVINFLVAGYFALLHYHAYGNPLYLLQPFIAGLINTIIAIEKRNLTGVILGHYLTDAVIYLGALL